MCDIEAGLRMGSTKAAKDYMYESSAWETACKHLRAGEIHQMEDETR